MADQLVLPASLASGPSRFTVNEITKHLSSNAWVIEQIGVADIRFADSSDKIEVRVALHPGE